jgi:hypothetical protein
MTITIPSITREELTRYLRKRFNLAADDQRIVREAKRLGCQIEELARAGDHDALLRLVTQIKGEPLVIKQKCAESAPSATA